MAKWNLTDLEREKDEQIAELKSALEIANDQIRRAQERIRAAEAREVGAWNEAIEAAWLVAMQRVDVALRIEGDDEAQEFQDLGDRIRSLAKEAGE